MTCTDLLKINKPPCNYQLFILTAIKIIFSEYLQNICQGYYCFILLWGEKSKIINACLDNWLLLKCVDPISLLPKYLPSQENQLLSFHRSLSIRVAYLAFLTVHHSLHPNKHYFYVHSRDIVFLKFDKTGSLLTKPKGLNAQLHPL